MGRFRFESNRMKVLIAGLLCAAVALALPEGRRLRAEEHWRPAQGRDLSKYKPRHAMVPATKEDLSMGIKEVKKNGASTKKGTNIDLKATCGIEGPAAAERIVGGHEAEEHQWPWQVAQTRNATTSTELLETELSASTLLEERDLAMVTLVAPSS